MLCLVYYFRLQMKLSRNYYESPQSPLWMMGLLEFHYIYTKSMWTHKQYKHVLLRMHFRNMEH